MSESNVVKFKGVEIELGDQKFIIPPLNFRQLEDFGDTITRLSKLKDSNDIFGDMGKAVPLIHAAISRNYPDVKLEDLRDLVDMSNYRLAIEAVMGVSGITEAISKRTRDSIVTPGGTPPVVQ